jgi:heme A synthase
MRKEMVIFLLTALIIFLQAITGAITVLGIYDVGAHVNTGYVVGALTLATMIFALLAKPKYKALRYSAIVLFALVVVQGLLGFASMMSDVMVAVHFTNSLIVYGISIAMIFYAFRWGRMTK